jgi:hypothetical protein
MSKLFIYIFMLISTFIVLTTDCFAANAYSVGSKYASGVTGAGNDFTGLVATAADSYGWLSGYNSYYSYQPSYTYLKSTSRLGKSKVFFIAGHANPNLISTAAKDTDSYRTGISRYNDGYVAYDEAGKKFTYAGLAGRSMSGTTLITFAGCSTGAYNNGERNLLQQSITSGAKAAVGFNNMITNMAIDTNWLAKYNNLLGNGWTIRYSIEKANAAYPGRCASYVTKEGNIDVSIGTLARTNSLGINIGSSRVVESSIEDEYLRFDMTNNISIKKLYETKEEKPELINDVMMKIDSSFTFDNYKITYNLLDDAGYGFVFLTYFINEEIQTNKVYMIVTSDYNIKKIYLAGVKKENISNIDKINNNNMVEKFKSFEKNEKESFISKSRSQNRNLTLMRDSSIIEEEEKYYLDYNTGNLTFVQTVFSENADAGIIGDSIEEIVK